MFSVNIQTKLVVKDVKWVCYAEDTSSACKYEIQYSHILVNKRLTVGKTGPLRRERVKVMLD